MLLIDDGKKLPVAERAALLEALQEDEGMYNCLLNKEFPKEAMEELARRDRTLQDGKVILYTWEEAKIKLNMQKQQFLS